MNKDWIVIYTTSQFDCKWCNKLKELLNVYGFDFYEKDIYKEERYKQEFVAEGFRTVPQVYIEGVLVGGYEMTKNYMRSKFFENHPNKDKIIEELRELE